MLHTEPFLLHSQKAHIDVPWSRDASCLSAESQPGHRVSISLNIGEQVELEVSFSSDKPLNVKTKMLLQVADNQYNETAIQVSGEAYQEVVSVSNISRSLQEVDVEDGDEGERKRKVANAVLRKQNTEKNSLPAHCHAAHSSLPPLPDL